MQDYVMGALQALTWVRELINKVSKDDSKAFERLVKEVDDALNDIEHGVAVDFRWRIKTP